MAQNRYKLAKTLLPRARALREHVVVGDMGEDAVIREFNALCDPWGYPKCDEMDDDFLRELDFLLLELEDYVEDEEGGLPSEPADLSPNS